MISSVSMRVPPPEEVLCHCLFKLRIVANVWRQGSKSFEEQSFLQSMIVMLYSCSDYLSICQIR